MRREMWCVGGNVMRVGKCNVWWEWLKQSSRRSLAGINAWWEKLRIGKERCLVDNGIPEGPFTRATESPRFYCWQISWIAGSWATSDCVFKHSATVNQRRACSSLYERRHKMMKSCQIPVTIGLNEQSSHHN